MRWDDLKWVRDSTEKSFRTRPRVRKSARGRVSERPLFSALVRSFPPAAEHRWRHTLYPLHYKLREKLCPLYRMC